MKYADVIVSISNKNVDRIFSYFIPEDIRPYIMLGMRVNVPFGKGNRKYEGYVVGFSDVTDVSEDKIKSILNIPDKIPVFSENMISLAWWMREKYYANLSDCLKCIMPSIVKEKVLKYAYINRKLDKIDEVIEEIIKKNNKQSKVLKLLLQFDGISVKEITSVLEITSEPIKALEKKGILKLYDREIKREYFDFSKKERTKPFVPTDEQENAINFILERAFSKNEKKKPILLHGVTGSGKTEIYLQVIDEIIKKGQQAIVLVPEISLTPQTVSRFTGRFGGLVSVTHSKMARSERFEQWKKARNGEISVMIGPRSAIFTPFENLGIIIIDEEHESTYKSETTPKYDAREVAYKICELTGALTVLGSATPNVEDYYKAKENIFELVTIKNRVNKCFPEVFISDMRYELETGNRSIFSRELFEGMKLNLENGRQTILFLNRRGHSTFISCRSCGYVMECDNCNVNYTYHMSIDKLICHYCGKSLKTPKECPQCGSSYIKYFGVGTQKVETEVLKLFPHARVLRMDLDTTSKKNSHDEILKKFALGEADILIGTQMIAKGLDFPRVSLVGVIAADLSLNNGDYKCAENTFQLLTQVSGRAGRAEVSGKVFIQTYNPEHYSIRFAKNNDYLGFYEHEISLRRIMNYPPFSNIFFIMFYGEDEKKIITRLYRLVDIMKKYNKNNAFEQIGPAPASVSKIKRQYRWKLIVKAEDETRLKNYVLYCLNKLSEQEDISGISINIALNPTYCS